MKTVDEYRRANKLKPFAVSPEMIQKGGNMGTVR